MPGPRYRREEEEYAGPMSHRALLVLVILGTILGLFVGAAWIAWRLWTLYLS